MATPAASVRIYQSIYPITPLKHLPGRRWLSSSRWLVGLAVVVGCGAALAVSNPSMEDYSDYAGEQLVGLATEEFCDQKGLPLIMGLWVRNCPQLIAAQQDALASLATRFTNRLNLGVCSVYITALGGQDLLPNLRLPGYRVITLAGAGQFVTISTREEPGSLP
ncbi:MAG: DUF4359 domain-containing protein [Prochlorococcus sp.]|nr:DUF4359 domain-containing protein [Prochlorococcaceae cyanobacterium Fu_MAG_50]